jgi:hypothetical protein
MFVFFRITPVADITMTEGVTNTTAYQVVLGTEPASNVVIDITEASPQITLNTASLTFTTLNWNTPQNVSVTATEDSNSTNEVDQIVTFAINDASSDNQFDPLANQTRQIDFIDNDIPSFSITQTSGSTSVIEEGATDSFSIVLGAQPSNNVVIDVTSSDTSALTLSVPEVAFTTVDWNVPKNVTVTGINDPDTDNETVFRLETGCSIRLRLESPVSYLTSALRWLSRTGVSIHLEYHISPVQILVVSRETNESVVLFYYPRKCHFHGFQSFLKLLNRLYALKIWCQVDQINPCPWDMENKIKIKDRTRY